MPTIAATCAVQTDRLAVDSAVGVAPDCIHRDAAKPGSTLFGIAILSPRYALLDQPNWLPRGWIVNTALASAPGCASI